MPIVDSVCSTLIIFPRFYQELITRASKMLSRLTAYTVALL